jgi:ABC-type multidrug transport system fused ATPase/permease subunit
MTYFDPDHVVDVLTPVFIVIGAFWTVWQGRLSAPDVFATLALTMLLVRPLMTIISSCKDFFSTLACFSRLQAYLLAEEIEDSRNTTTDPGSPQPVGQNAGVMRSYKVSLSKRRTRPKTAATYDYIKFVNAFIAPVKGKSPVLRDVSLCIARSEFAIVIGPTGSGKTTFLRSLLGEAHIMDGSGYVTLGSAAYCGQSPWLEDTSVRQNITAENNYDPVWYEVVIKACCLNDDKRELRHGDQTRVGNNGIRLSGGQKQRVVSGEDANGAVAVG